MPLVTDSCQLYCIFASSPPDPHFVLLTLLSQSSNWCPCIGLAFSAPHALHSVHRMSFLKHRSGHAHSFLKNLQWLPPVSLAWYYRSLITPPLVSASLSRPVFCHLPLPPCPVSPAPAGTSLILTLCAPIKSPDAQGLSCLGPVSHCSLSWKYQPLSLSD